MWNIQSNSDQKNKGITGQALTFLEVYNNDSKYNFGLYELAPYILAHDIWSIGFLIKYQLLTPQTARTVLSGSVVIFSMLKPYLKAN
ncbi:hypothetical protein [Acinetobacter nectaris]|nr:hypothetical protein [Acinetobacter nectaris]MCF8998989.1 hypothetical protein [Acinetobacter nectaris]